MDADKLCLVWLFVLVFCRFTSSQIVDMAYNCMLPV